MFTLHRLYDFEAPGKTPDDFIDTLRDTLIEDPGSDERLVQVLDITNPRHAETWVEDGVQTDAYAADVEYIAAPRQTVKGSERRPGLRTVDVDDAHVVMVASETSVDGWYVVTILPGPVAICSCPASRHHPERVCKHAWTAIVREAVHA